VHAPFKGGGNIT